MSDHTSGDLSQHQDEEARRDDRRFRERNFGPAPLPFQFQVPLGGGAPGIAIPVGGYRSPLALTVPLGGTPVPATTPVAGSATGAPAAATGTPAGQPPAPPRAVPAAVAVVDAPLDFPPDAPGGAEPLGEQVLSAAEAFGRTNASGSSRAFLEALLGETFVQAEALSAPAFEGATPSATTLFRAIVLPPDGSQSAHQQRCANRFQILARPGEPIASVGLLRGDLLIRIARGEGWGFIGVVGAPGPHPHDRLSSLGLRFEGYPRLEPGAYAHLVEPGPPFRGLDARFARRVCDASGLVLPDTLLLRLRPPPELAPEPQTTTTPREAQDLRTGGSGAAVRRAQSQLNRIHLDLIALQLPGLAGCPLPEDGRFGDRMAQAVLALQQQVFASRAQWDGVIGPATRRQLDLLAGAGGPSSADEAEAEGGDPNIRWLQDALNRLINAGLIVDGIRGPRTTAAVRKFQQSRGLTVDGVVGRRTLAALRAGGDATSATLPTRCTGIPERQVLDHFEFGRAEVLPRHQPQIVNLAFCILESQRGPTPITALTLIGHTDPVGSEEENNALGRRRAEAVRDQIAAAIAGISKRPAQLRVTVESRGMRDQLPGDPALSRRVEVVAPFAFPGVTPPPPKPVSQDAALRALLTASMLLTANPTAPFAAAALPAGRQSGAIWAYDLSLASGAMRAGAVTCVIPHPGGRSHAMTVAEEVNWEGVELTLTGGAQAPLPLDARFLLGSFNAGSGVIAARTHPIWRLASEIDVGTAAVFAYDITNPASPQPITDLSALTSPAPDRTQSRLWALVCCELVLCKTRNDFEPAGVLDAARLYPLIEVLTNAETSTIRGVIRLRRPVRSAMDHGWGNGGRHLVGLYADRNNNLGLFEAMLALTGRSGRAIPTWDDMFDYVLKDGAASNRSLVVVDPAKSALRSDTTHRQALDRATEANRPSAVVKLPRQAAFDNIHIAPQMEVSLSVPLLGGIPSTAVSMAPVCAHDCFHIHWRWSQHYTEEQNLGWGPSGPYTQPGAPMVHPNQIVTVATVAGVPGFRYEAAAAAHPANNWMVVMPHGAAYAVQVNVAPAVVLEKLLDRAFPIPIVRSAILAAAAGAEDRLFAWIYFFLQFWPALQSSPRLRPLGVITCDVPALTAL